MKIIHPTKGVQLSQFYTPTAAFLAEFPDFSLDRPTSFFTEAYYVDESIGIALTEQDEKGHESEEQESNERKKKGCINKLLARCRYSKDREPTRELLVYVGRQDKDAFAALHERLNMKDNREWVNGVCMYIPSNYDDNPENTHLKCDEENAMCVYGVLRYVIADDIVLDRVLFHVPSMLVVPSHNQHNQFCIGTVCAADVQDVLTVRSHVAVDEDGKKSLRIRQPERKFNLQESSPRLDKCMNRKHSSFNAFRYWKSNMHGKYHHVDETLSDLRAPLAGDFASLGLEEAYAHALANPPPKRERWQDFPMMKIIYCDENTKNKKVVQAEEAKKTDATADENKKDNVSNEVKDVPKQDGSPTE